jgi:hypothetical protein
MAELFEAAWFFLPGIPPYAVCDDVQALAAWADRNVPRQGKRARPLLVDNESRLWFLESDGHLSAVSTKRGRSNHPSQWERYWRVRDGVDAWYQPAHEPHPPGRRAHIPIQVSVLSEADQSYLDWLESTWQSLD